MSRRFETLSGIELAQFYSGPSASAPEKPGEFPYTRGIHSGMYRDKLWTIRQYAGFGSAHETNLRYQYLLSQGSTGLSAAFDLPTQMGRDPDHPLSKGEVGRVGVSISTVEDMEILLQDLPLDRLSLSMTINSTAMILLALVLVVAERRNVSWDLLQGTVQNDILKEYIARGTYIYPPNAGLRLTTDLIEFCSSNVPKWNTISVSGYHMREAGCTAAQEIAFTLANGIVYLEQAKVRGLDLNKIGERIAFFFNCHNDLFEEVAKFRAARRMWSQITRERFGITNPRANMLRFHTQTAGSSLTMQQPHNNLVRTTIQALAAVMGGTQSLHTNGFDEAIGLPTEAAAALAVKTQQIIAHESGVPNVVDPLGGSYLVEALTDKLQSLADLLIQDLDGRGGMLRAIEDGIPQGEIERAAYQYQNKVESGDRIVVGVNLFQTNSEAPISVTKINPALEPEQVARILRFKQNRDQGIVASKLDKLRDLAASKQNIMPGIIEVVRANGTLGEISEVLRTVFGEFKPTKW